MKRFERILNFKPRKGGISAAAAVLCCSLLLSGLIGCTEAKTETAAVKPQETVQQETVQQEAAQQEAVQQEAAQQEAAQEEENRLASLLEEEHENTITCFMEFRGSEGNMNADEAMKLINQYRTEKGFSELITATPSDGSGLYEAALVRLEESKEMFSHTRPNGENFATAFVLVSGTDYVEILGAGHITAEEFIGAITAEPDVESEQQKVDAETAEASVNLKNQLLCDITHGCVVVDQDSEGQPYWVFAACKINQ